MTNNKQKKWQFDDTLYLYFYMYVYMYINVYMYIKNGTDIRIKL